MCRSGKFDQFETIDLPVCRSTRWRAIDPKSHSSRTSWRIVTADIELFNPRKRWRKVQDVIPGVWSRWLKEYLPTLSTRSEWNEVVKDFKKGDVVLAMEKSLPRGH